MDFVGQLLGHTKVGIINSEWKCYNQSQFSYPITITSTLCATWIVYALYSRIKSNANFQEKIRGILEQTIFYWIVEYFSNRFRRPTPASLRSDSRFCFDNDYSGNRRFPADPKNNSIASLSRLFGLVFAHFTWQWSVLMSSHMFDTEIRQGFLEC